MAAGWLLQGGCKIKEGKVSVLFVASVRRTLSLSVVSSLSLRWSVLFVGASSQRQSVVGYNSAYGIV
ncbi:hypothetical protein DdX_18403 [Ditylenchus destructor]|uniref:Uncharacterized protein n=1 Tax=Ditylenchus destructor TaxID=166010 RepID=A0AAD4MKA9_9BILA|nr:hypothetical protein DdX_18403 [Ditylenchus destructor]